MYRDPRWPPQEQEQSMSAQHLEDFFVLIDMFLGIRNSKI